MDRLFGRFIIALPGRVLVLNEDGRSASFHEVRSYSDLQEVVVTEGKDYVSFRSEKYRLSGYRVGFGKAYLVVWDGGFLGQAGVVTNKYLRHVPEEVHEELLAWRQHRSERSPSKRTGVMTIEFGRSSDIFGAKRISTGSRRGGIASSKPRDI